MMQLMEELTSTENKVAFARQAYNDSVMTYNTARESFRQTMIAGAFNFRERGTVPGRVAGGAGGAQSFVQTDRASSGTGWTTISSSRRQPPGQESPC
jgi:hypothetical protein